MFFLSVEHKKGGYSTTCSAQNFSFRGGLMGQKFLVFSFSSARAKSVFKKPVLAKTKSFVFLSLHKIGGMMARDFMRNLSLPLSMLLRGFSFLFHR